MFIFDIGITFCCPNFIKLYDTLHSVEHPQEHSHEHPQEYSTVTSSDPSTLGH